MEKVGDEETRCAEACACEDKDSGKQPTAKCKRACGGCRNETAQKLHLCKKIEEAPSVAARAPQPKTEPAESASRPKPASAKSAPQPKPAPAWSVPAKSAPQPKKVDTGTGLKPLEL